MLARYNPSTVRNSKIKVNFDLVEEILFLIELNVEIELIRMLAE